MKKIFAILTMLVTLLVASVSLAAAPSLQDNAKVMTPQERQAVTALLKKVEADNGIRCVVVTEKAIQDTPADFANSLVNNVYTDGKNGTILFLQVTGNRKWHVSTDLKMKEAVVGQDGLEYMSKEFLPLLKKGDNVGAYKAFATKAGELAAYYKANGKGWEPDYTVPGAIIALILSAGIGFIYMAYLRGTMSNVADQVAADAYINKESFNLTYQNDMYMGSRTTVVEKASKSDDDNGSSGSGSSSNGGGGGGY